MNIYDAVMKAADHIERNPGLYSFMPGWVPECGTPGCVVGWVAHFLGCERGVMAANTAAMAPFRTGAASTPWLDFHETAERRGFDMGGIQTDAAAAVRYMRHVAAKYLTPAKPAQKIDWNALAERLGREPLLVNSESTALRAEAR